MQTVTKNIIKNNSIFHRFIDINKNTVNTIRSYSTFNTYRSNQNTILQEHRSNSNALNAPTSKTILTQQINSSNIKYQQRYFGSWGMRFIMGFTIIGVMFFARRWQPRQKKRIIKKFQKGPDEIDMLSMTAKERTVLSPFLYNLPSALVGGYGSSSENPYDVSIPFNRKKEESYLNKFLSMPPLGPLVIVGPEGSGKSHIVRRVISSREMSILVDMRQNAVMTGDELLLSFLKKMGYLLPSSDPISSLVMKGDKKQKINVEEIVQGLDTVFQALLEIRDKYKIVPLITISNLETMPTSDNFTRFLDWCISITDNKLANILFLTTSQFVHFHLDSKTNQVRNYLNTVYRPNGSVENNGTITAGTLNNNSNQLISTKNLLEQGEIENMIEIFGGQMRDIDLISGLIVRGENYKYVVDLFLSETIHKIGSVADSMYQKSNLSDIDDKEKKAILEKYQRYWKMLEIITERQTIIVNDIIQEIFDEQPEELDEYFSLNIIYFWMGTVYQHNLPEISMALKQQQQQSQKLQQTCSPSLDNSVQMTSKISSSSGNRVTGYDTFVSFSSPRIQYASKMLLNDHRFIQQRQAVKKYFHKTELKDEKKDLEEKKQLTQSEFEKVIQRLDNLFTNAKEWVRSVGEKDFEDRKNNLIRKELQLQKELDDLNAKLFAIEEQLN
ncbi:hypothetical protein DLAC_06224 [Tieghemostelium lacteum]|uniref:Uncharacterized protein n=1 Tax=Tieghemostelium lacteum TaxID=361077 RepID=A0A151ZHT1_TIELA|nr:hypothetical protein DLAC_06224 [Tieghemostelium lacteum]|eukprot:KYQ93523.1 hypothetical protein DLAC_06224 [Tieghemostelium lacteum]